MLKYWMIIIIIIIIAFFFTNVYVTDILHWSNE